VSTVLFFFFLNGSKEEAEVSSFPSSLSLSFFFSLRYLFFEQDQKGPALTALFFFFPEKNVTF